MPDTEVLQGEATEKPAVPKGQQAETITMSKAERDSLIRERDEAKQSERYWAERARGGKETEEVEEEEPIDTSDIVSKTAPKVSGAADVDEAIYSDPEKWLEAISKGPKAIQALVRKATEGYVNADQVAEIAAKIARRTVDVERGKITTDNKLMTQFPELADKDSELFKATAEEYRALTDFHPDAKKSPATLFAAARAAKARLAAAAKPKREEEEEGEYGYERVEGERLARVNAQDGTRGGRPARGEEAETSIGPQARAVLEGMGVSEERYRASAKAIGRKR